MTNVTQNLSHDLQILHDQVKKKTTESISRLYRKEVSSYSFYKDYEEEINL